MHVLLTPVLVATTLTTEGPGAEALDSIRGGVFDVQRNRAIARRLAGALMRARTVGAVRRAAHVWQRRGRRGKPSVLDRAASLLGRGAMNRYLRICTALVLTGAFALTTPANAAPSTPKWVLHVQKFTGGISNGVRAYLDADLIKTRGGGQAASPARAAVAQAASVEGDPISNIQMNTDS